MLFYTTFLWGKTTVKGFVPVAEDSSHVFKGNKDFSIVYRLVMGRFLIFLIPTPILVILILMPIPAKSIPKFQYWLPVLKVYQKEPVADYPLVLIGLGAAGQYVKKLRPQWNWIHVIYNTYLLCYNAAEQLNTTSCLYVEKYHPTARVVSSPKVRVIQPAETRYLNQLIESNEYFHINCIFNSLNNFNWNSPLIQLSL